jgi:hypothetical protein
MAGAAAVMVATGGYSVLEGAPTGVEEGPEAVATSQPSTSTSPGAADLPDLSGAQQGQDARPTDLDDPIAPAVTLSAGGTVSGPGGGPGPGTSYQHADAGAAVDPFGAPATSVDGTGPVSPATPGSSAAPRIGSVAGTGNVGRTESGGSPVPGVIPDLAADGVLRPETESAPATAATSLSLQSVRRRSGHSWVKTVVLRGTLRTARGAKPVVGTVTVWTRTSSGKPWVMVEGSARTTSSTGNVQITLTQKARRAQYRLAFAQAAPYRASTSRPIAVTVT